MNFGSCFPYNGGLLLCKRARSSFTSSVCASAPPYPFFLHQPSMGGTIAYDSGMI